MSYEPIRKSPEFRLSCNMPDYEEAYRGFSWQSARAQLAGLPGGQGLNIAYEAVDRHAIGPFADKVAIRWLARSGDSQDYTYEDLRKLTNRFANVLRELGIGKGDAVFSLCGRIPQLMETALGTFKNTSVFCPLFSAFGPEPVRERLSRGRARVLVTTEPLYLRKVQSIRESVPELEQVILIGSGDEVTAVDGTVDFNKLMADADDRFEIPPTDPEDVALLHFTSGTTGTPKAAIHVHEAVVSHHITGRLALDLHPDDIYWCTADPGWVTGTSYGIISPLTNGVTSIIDEAEFDATRWYQTLQDQKVTIWYTAPTAIRLLIKAGEELAAKHDLGRLRFVGSVGEPLNPEGVVWGLKALGLPVHDNWWQTETGGIMIANFASSDVRPGSMGRPVPGIEAAILRRDEYGSIVVHDGVAVIEESGRQGELALRPGWPSMFRGYLGQPERYSQCFIAGWYLTGDLAVQDAEGYLWFVGRGDDVIKSAGHLVGPFEVESVLLEHPAVAEAGVIGIPDQVAGEIVKAFVMLRSGVLPTDELRRELLGHARKRLGGIAPRRIDFRETLPRTRSGKIMRRLLRARELGLSEGDISTLEESES